jgi:hypothetical protein
MFSMQVYFLEDDEAEVKSLLGNSCKMAFPNVRSIGGVLMTYGIVTSKDEDCINGSRKRLMQSGYEVGTISESEKKAASEELRFGSEEEALQFLSDLTGKAIKVS